MFGLWFSLKVHGLQIGAPLEHQSWNNANPESTESFADLFASRTSLKKNQNVYLDLLDFLELVQLAKHRKWFLLAARDVAGRQCLPVVLEDSQKLSPILPKMRCVWFGFEMTPSTDRTTVLYCTTVDCTIL